MITLTGEDVEEACKEASVIPRKIDLQAREGAKAKEVLFWLLSNPVSDSLHLHLTVAPALVHSKAKLAQGNLTLFFKNSKNIDYEALKNKKGARSAKDIMAARIAKARKDWEI